MREKFHIENDILYRGDRPVGWLHKDGEYAWREWPPAPVGATCYNGTQKRWLTEKERSV